MAVVGNVQDGGGIRFSYELKLEKVSVSGESKKLVLFGVLVLLCLSPAVRTAVLTSVERNNDYLLLTYRK